MCVSVHPRACVHACVRMHVFMCVCVCVCVHVCVRALGYTAYLHFIQEIMVVYF